MREQIAKHAALVDAKFARLEAELKEQRAVDAKFARLEAALKEQRAHVARLSKLVAVLTPPTATVKPKTGKPKLVVVARNKRAAA